MPTTSWRRVVAVAAAAVLTGCGGGGSADPHAGHAAATSVPEPVAGAEEVTVEAVDVDYEPATLELTAGEPLNVTVTNGGEALHDFTLDEAGVHVNVEPGDTVATSLTLDEPGRYEVRCTVPGHADAGMTIDVTVAE